MASKGPQDKGDGGSTKPKKLLLPFVRIERIPAMDEAAIASKYKNVPIHPGTFRLSRSGLILPATTNSNQSSNDVIGEHELNPDTLFVELKEEIPWSEGEEEGHSLSHKDNNTALTLEPYKIKIEDNQSYEGEGFEENIPRIINTKISHPLPRSSLSPFRLKRKSSLEAEAAIRKMASLAMDNKNMGEDDSSDYDGETQASEANEKDHKPELIDGSNQPLRRGQKSKRPTPCPHCGKTLSSRYEVKDHIRRIHLNQRPHQCEFCEKTFLFARELVKHTDWKHSDRSSTGVGGGDFPCSLCSKRLGTQRRWAIHEATICKVDGWDPERLKKEFKVNIYPCPVQPCDKIFPSRSDQERHIRTHVTETGLTHTGIALRPHSCKLCGKSYTDKGCLKTHSEVCGRSEDAADIRRQQAARRRERRKTEKPYFCLVCQPNKRFTHANLLIRHNSQFHNQKESGIKEENINCNLCGLSVLPSQIVSHRVRFHDTQRNVTCPHCERRFYNEHDRNQHITTIHGPKGEKRHICQECGQVFRHRPSLSVHRRKVHHIGGEFKRGSRKKSAK